MARGKSPWGGGSGDEPGEEKSTDDANQADGAEPRNPWLSPDEVAPKPRRSASIEDILRQRPRVPGQLRSSWAGLLLFGLIGAWLVATSLHMLDRDQRGLVLTMGRFSHTIGPGVNLTLPWPLQSVVRRKALGDEMTMVPDKDGETLMPTRDGELIDVSFRIRWRVTDLQAFVFNLPEGEAALRRLGDAQVRAAVAELPFSAAYGSDKRGQLQLRAAERMQRVLDGWHSGVKIVSIELVRVGPPARLAETFQKIETARDNARRQRENDQAWRQQQLANARHEAAEFDRVYAQYKIAPAVIRQKMYYETMERILRNNTVVAGGNAAGTPQPPAPSAKPAEQ
ncbi:protease modulator HflK [Novosphingobium sp.]|uniref:protease modulator HflK n=1 Tax=Novosphingobium sp. TaxID=1874826 RepID=UPI0037041B83